MYGSPCTVSFWVYNGDMMTLLLVAVLVDCLLTLVAIASVLFVWRNRGNGESGGIARHPSPQGPSAVPVPVATNGAYSYPDWPFGAVGKRPVTEDKGEAARIEARKQAELERIALLERGILPEDM